MECYNNDGTELGVDTVDSEGRTAIHVDDEKPDLAVCDEFRPKNDKTGKAVEKAGPRSIKGYIMVRATVDSPMQLLFVHLCLKEISKGVYRKAHRIVKYLKFKRMNPSIEHRELALG